MAHEHTYEMIAQARRRLLRTTIDIVTNGDFLNPTSLARLREAGLSILRINVYMRRGVAWSVEAAAREELQRLGRAVDAKLRMIGVDVS